MAPSIDRTPHLMKGAVLSEEGNAPTPADFAEPGARPGQTVIEVEAAGLNPIDLATAAGAVVRPPVPSVVGREGIGREPSGRRVYFDAAIPPHGSFAKRCLVAADDLIPVPEGIDAAAAMPFGIAGLAAWLGLGWRGTLREGETVLVLGASSVVGAIAVQIARRLGAGRIVAAARGAAQLERVAALGADASVVLDGAPVEELASRMRDAAGGGGVDLVLDMLWGEPAAAAIGAMATHGRLIQIGNSAAPTLELPARPLRVGGFSILAHMNFLAPTALKAEAFATMCGLAESGELVVPVEEVPLAAVRDAWERQARSPHVKLVIRP
jgi:NADPH2:quinone reductase